MQGTLEINLLTLIISRLEVILFFYTKDMIKNVSVSRLKLSIIVFLLVINFYLKELDFISKR